MKINVSDFKCQNGVSFPAVYKIEVHLTSDGTLDLIKYVICMVAGTLSMLSFLVWCLSSVSDCYHCAARALRPWPGKCGWVGADRAVERVLYALSPFICWGKDMCLKNGMFVAQVGVFYLNSKVPSGRERWAPLCLCSFQPLSWSPADPTPCPLHVPLSILQVLT